MAEHDHPSTRFTGPKAWGGAVAAGAAAGWILSLIAPGSYAAGSAMPAVPLWMSIPFAALLLSVAVMPFLAPRFWHRRYPEVSLLLGALVAAYFLSAYATPGYKGGLSYGAYAMEHAALEYYSFFALVGGLYIASGAVVVEVRGRGGPLLNTAMLAGGAVLANLVGTTGASVLLIRPFLRANAGRLAPMHVVFFILIVSNCGGCLTPIGDPPLYLGYLKGIPFFWTLEHLWGSWLLVIGALLAAFAGFDVWIGRRAKIPGVHPAASTSLGARPGLRVRGVVPILGLALLTAGVFVDPLLKSTPAAGWPVGATFQAIVAIATYLLSDPEGRRANQFSFEPLKEVGLLFAGIFATMAPALAYLATHGHQLGLSSPTEFHLGTGALSAVLDNAPTYLNFLQVAVGQDLDPASIAAMLSTPAGVRLLAAISTAAVFFGALTYIGNGPNFMVKAIAEGSGVRMPSFFGYLGRAALALGPALILHWAVFIR